MNLIELAKYLNDEELAEQYLLDKGILKTWTHCPHCNSDKLGKISRGRIKCYKCKKEWHKRKDSFLEGRHISSSKFIAFLKLYSDEIGVNQITSELLLDKKTVIELTKEIRKITTNEYVAGISENSNSAILFEKDKTLHVKFDSQNVMHDSYVIDFVRYKEQGNLYSFLIESDARVDKRGKVNSIDRFLSFAKMKLISYRGVKIEYLKGYLIELVVKFNLMDISFYDYVLKRLQFQRVANIPPS